MDTIRNPLEWGRDVLKFFGRAAQLTSRSIEGVEDTSDNVTPKICQIEISDFKEILAKGLKDFGAGRTDVIFICIIYPVVGFLLIQFAFERNVLPLLFPLASGFALIAPLTAVGLYEMSRRREQGLSATWADAFRALQSPSFGAMFALGLFLIVIFMLWLGAAQVIYWATLGPEPPTSITVFISDVLTTGAGWAMIIMNSDALLSMIPKKTNGTRNNPPPITVVSKN